MRDRRKIAAITTIYHNWSHAQHIVDRFLDGYSWKGRHHRPPVDVVSLYVDQVGDDDLSRDREEQFPSMKIYPTIADALTLGGHDLAVDGVLLIGEHGKYERNEKNQILYPRYEFFMELVKVFRASGRAVPVFNDKHLSWNWDHARQMYDLSQSLGFAFMAGSSLPVTRRLPPVEMPMGARIDEALCICPGEVDVLDFHGLETIQCMVERRAGGEKGVRWIETYRGHRFWEAHEQQVWSRDLFDAALCRSDTIKPSKAGFTSVGPGLDDMKRIVEDPMAYHYEHNDGLRCTLLLLKSLVEDYNFSARVAGRAEPLSTQMYLSMPRAGSDLATFFSPLVNCVERMFLSGKPSYPVERTLLTTGLTAAAMDSQFQEQKRIDTPHLAIAYAPTARSTFWRS